MFDAQRLRGIGERWQHDASLPLASDLGSLILEAVDEIGRLGRQLDAQSALLSWYEEDHVRSSYDDAELPDELIELEAALRAAKAVKGKS